MILNQTDLYAIRAMVHLTLIPEGEFVSAQDMADKIHVKSHYLNKIMRRLVEAGLVVSRKGHYGGFHLAKPPADIRIFDVLEAVKPDHFYEFCAFGWETCSSTHPCPLHHTWKELKERFCSWAVDTTLANIQQNNQSVGLSFSELLPPNSDSGKT